MTIPLAVVAGFVPLAMRVWNRRGEGINGMGTELVADVTGFDPAAGQWHWQYAMRGLGPILGGVIVHKIAGYLGVNKAIARTGIPFIRI